MSDLDRKALAAVREWLKGWLVDDRYPGMAAFDRAFPPPAPDLEPCIWCGGKNAIEFCDSSQTTRRVQCQVSFCHSGPLADSDAEAIAAYLAPIKRAEHRGRIAGLEEAYRVEEEAGYVGRAHQIIAERIARKESL